MFNLGQINTLTYLRQTDFGYYLGDGDGEDVLLPKKWAPENFELDDEIDVFVYLDHEERPIATTMTPKIKLWEFRYLKVKDVNSIGAFMDWGLEKDLLVPYKNQPKNLELGKWYCIYLYLDEETDRLVGTARINGFIDQDEPEYEIAEKVDILVCEDTDLGVNVIVDDQHRGLVYYSDIFKDIKRGDRIKGYIKQVREDGKLDITLEPTGTARLEPMSKKVLDYITQCGGQTTLTDKSAPEDIYKELEISKKAFKAALGNLYKAGKVVLSKEVTKLK